MSIEVTEEGSESESTIGTKDKVLLVSSLVFSSEYQRGGVDGWCG